MSEKTVSIAFTGDLSFTKYFNDSSVKEKFIDNNISDFLMQSDYCVGNIEGPIMSSEYSNGKEFSHFTDESKAALLADMNIKIWSLANNHMLDFGDNGVKETLKHAENNGCCVIGSGEKKEIAHKKIIIPKCGGIGIVSVTYSPSSPKNGGEYGCLNWNDNETIGKLISEMKKECRWCLLVVHGGDEFSDMPMPYTREKYIGFLNMGFDIIIGHHPHVVQNYEMFDNKIIFYSLGNFIFDTNYQRSQKHTDYGVLLKLTFSDNTFEWEKQGTIIERNEQYIKASQVPVIFRNVNSSEYNKLWKYAARGLIAAERKILKYLKPEKYHNYNSLKWILRDMYSCRRKRDRILVKGKLLSYLTGNKAIDRELIRYLIEK